MLIWHRVAYARYRSTTVVALISMWYKYTGRFAIVVSIAKFTKASAVRACPFELLTVIVEGASNASEVEPSRKTYGPIEREVCGM